MSRHKTILNGIRRWKGIFAAVLVLLQVVLLTSAVVPDFHRALHGHSHAANDHDHACAAGEHPQSDDHHCVVVDLALGQLDCMTLSMPVVGMGNEIHKAPDVSDTGVVIPSPLLSLLHERGPPA